MQARVELTPPSYITLGALDRGGVIDQGAAVWVLSLAAGESTTIDVPATVGEIPDGERRATALNIACTSLGFLSRSARVTCES